jgi:hypothetical protein
LDTLPDYTAHESGDQLKLTSTQLGHTRPIKHKNRVHKPKTTSTKAIDSLFGGGGEARNSGNAKTDDPNSSVLFNYDDEASGSSDDTKNGKNSLIEKDKRRHYLSNSKQLLNLGTSLVCLLMLKILLID